MPSSEQPRETKVYYSVHQLAEMLGIQPWRLDRILLVHRINPPVRINKDRGWDDETYQQVLEIISKIDTDRSIMKRQPSA